MVKKPGWTTWMEWSKLTPSAMNEAELFAIWPDKMSRTQTRQTSRIGHTGSSRTGPHAGLIFCCSHLEVLHIFKHGVCICMHFALSPANNVAGSEQASLLWYSCQRCITWICQWWNIRQIQIDEHSTNSIACTLQKYEGHESHCETGELFYAEEA